MHGIEMNFDEATSAGVTIRVEGVGTGPNDVSTVDAVSLAQAILASDAIQNMPGWNGPPTLTNVSVERLEVTFP